MLSLEAARQPLSALAPLEDLQAVGTFPPVPSTHLPFPQHRLADFGPEVTGAAQPGRTVRRAQAEVTFLTFVGNSVACAQPGMLPLGMMGQGGRPPWGIVRQGGQPQGGQWGRTGILD